MSVVRFYIVKLFFFLSILPTASSCVQKQIVPPQLSSDKKLTYFAIDTYNNLGLYTTAVGAISNDTVRFTLTDGYPAFYLFPTIHFTGKHISPSETIAQNFSSPVAYTITAEDGTSKNYVVLGKTIYNHTSKDIVFFSFRASNNSGFVADVNGTITKDSVLVKLPSGSNLNALTPFIAINGVSVSPASLITQNFSQPIIYKVTAEDGSLKNYVVVVTN